MTTPDGFGSAQRCQKRDAPSCAQGETKRGRCRTVSPKPLNSAPGAPNRWLALAPVAKPGARPAHDATGMQSKDLSAAAAGSADEREEDDARPHAKLDHANLSRSWQAVVSLSVTQTGVMSIVKAPDRRRAATRTYGRSSKYMWGKSIKYLSFPVSRVRLSCCRDASPKRCRVRPPCGRIGGEGPNAHITGHHPPAGALSTANVYKNRDKEKNIRDREGTGLSPGIRCRIPGDNVTGISGGNVTLPLAIWSVPPRVPKMAH
jgi:hypothetical protein